MNSARTASPATRMIALIIAAILALGTAFALSGCGGNSEQVIRDGIDEQLGAFKNPTKETLAPYMGELDSAQISQLESYGIDIYEFLGHVLKKFDYTIGDITVDGDKATADISVTNIDASSIMNEAIDKAKSDPEVIAAMQKIAESGDQAEIMKYLMSYVYDALDAATETTTTDTQITLTKNGNTWEVDEESMSDLLVGMYGSLAS